MRTPETSIRSLIATGRPPKVVVDMSCFLAASKALSKHSVGNAFTVGSIAEIRSAKHSSNYNGEIEPFFSIKRISRAANRIRSDTIIVIKKALV